MGEARIFRKDIRHWLSPTISRVTQSLTFDWWSGACVGWHSQIYTDMEENDGCCVLGDRVEDKW